jgi:hypothetical protein
MTTRKANGPDRGEKPGNGLPVFIVILVIVTLLIQFFFPDTYESRMCQVYPTYFGSATARDCGRLITGH